jgi:hypothetical protein
MGCGCGGGRSYARRTGTTPGTSQHAPITRQMNTPRTDHSPQSAPPKVVQASALAARRNAVVRRQV